MHDDSVLQVPSISPCPRLQVAIWLCTVHKSVLEHWIAGAHQVVEDAASFHDGSDSFMVMLHGGEQNLEPVGQDAECVLHDPSCPGQPIVEDALFMGELSGVVRLHEVGPQ